MLTLNAVYGRSRFYSLRKVPCALGRKKHGERFRPGNACFQVPNAERETSRLAGAEAAALSGCAVLEPAAIHLLIWLFEGRSSGFAHFYEARRKTIGLCSLGWDDSRRILICGIKTTKNSEVVSCQSIWKKRSKKENEQLEKSESLLEKTVKKAMNFGRKPKNTQKKTAPKASHQEMQEEKEVSDAQKVAKKKRHPKKNRRKRPSPRTSLAPGKKRRRGKRPRSRRQNRPRSRKRLPLKSASQQEKKQKPPPSLPPEPGRRKPQKNRPAGNRCGLSLWEDWGKSGKMLPFMNRATICL